MNIYKGSAFIINPAGIKKIFASVISLVCCCLLQHAVAQDSLQQFGTANLAELQMTKCAFDQSASAMNLIKTADVKFDVSLNSGMAGVITEYRVRIKIFDEKLLTRPILLFHIMKATLQKLPVYKLLYTTWMLMEM